MNIALISSWNANCGVSAHAELIAKALQHRGHKLKVLAPTSYEDDNTRLLHMPDQSYVTRCYSFLRYGDRTTDEELLDSLYFNADPLLENSLDLVIAEKPTSIPLRRLAQALKRMSRTSRLVAILHEGTAPLNPYLGHVDWGATTIFDERYRPLFKGIIPDDRVHVIPFPCHPVERRSQSQSRNRLGFLEDVEIVFSYGNLREYQPVIDTVKRLGEERKELIYLLMASDPNSYSKLKNILGEDATCRVLFGRPPTETLYDYLCAADVLILHRVQPPHVAVSSAAHLCMGSLTPTLCSDTTHFDRHSGEIIKYRDMGEMEEELRHVLEGSASEVTSEARRYVEARSAEAVSKSILEVSG